MLLPDTRSWSSPPITSLAWTTFATLSLMPPETNWWSRPHVRQGRAALVRGQEPSQRAIAQPWWELSVPLQSLEVRAIVIHPSCASPRSYHLVHPARLRHQRVVRHVARPLGSPVPEGNGYKIAFEKLKCNPALEHLQSRRKGLGRTSIPGKRKIR